MSNPQYQPPPVNSKYFQDDANPYSAPYPGQYLPPPGSGYGWVQQIRVVAILNCVQGGLECLLGTMLVGMGIFLPIMIGMDNNNRAFRNNGQAGSEWVLLAIYGGFGAVVLAAGILRFYAGWQNFKFRKRVVGIVSFCCGLVSMLGCYCAPTAIGMLVYGLIVYLNPAVQAAFVMGEQGLSPDEILNSFLPYPPQQFGQPQFGQAPYGQPPPGQPLNPPNFPPPPPAV